MFLLELGKGFVLIDLKTKTKLYLNYFKAEESVEDDNEPIGIILSVDKNEVMVESATGGISNKIFVSKYQGYLPDKKLLQRQVKAIMESKRNYK